MITKSVAKKVVKSKFLKFNPSLNEGFEEILSLIDLEYPELRFNSLDKIRFAIGQLAIAKYLPDLESWHNSLQPLSLNEVQESELEIIKNRT